MKKRYVGILLVVAVLFAFTIGVMADNIVKDISAQLRPDFTVKIDGEEKVFKNAQGDIVYPVLYDGTTYLPIRAIGELMGKKVYWYEDDKLIELKDVKTTVTDADVIIGGSDEATDIVVNEKDKKLPDKEKFIGEKEAQNIALRKAGLTTQNVIFDRIELDNDNGIWHYEVEFTNGRTEYSADIKADDGTILKWEVDLDD